MEEHIVAVQKMQRYIHEHFDENISMQQLADVACYSKWHCIEFFMTI
ncbi:MAG: hypothetical protein ACOX6H_02565 [Christensenellales bacterium]